MQIIVLLCLLLTLSGCMAVQRDASSASVAVGRIECESASRDIVVNTPHPRLGWTITSTARDVRQTAYRVIVASNAELLAKNRGDLWDSGRVESRESVSVQYGGVAPASAQDCFWKIRLWTTAGETPWSTPGRWTTGILSPAEWHADWITSQKSAGRMPIFRRVVRVDKLIASARIDLCGLGQFELRLNGKKVGDDVIEPGWTNYRKTCLYVTRDITSQIRGGENVFAVALGNGMYNVPKTPGRYLKFDGSFGEPKLIARVTLRYSDGSTEIIGTDASWKSADGPTVFSNAYGGEDFDARLIEAGWDQPGFDDARWQAAHVVAGPGGVLMPSTAPPMHAMKILSPVTVKPCGADGRSWVYDTGQNCSQMPTITLSGKAGAAVKLIPAELLDAHGRASQDSMGGPAFLTYTLRGNADETWGPQFYYIGCRYWQIDDAVPEGQPNPQGLPVVRKFESRFVTSDSPEVGEFECSNDTFNRTATLIRWAMRSNMASVLTDCPHREKLGWLEQAHLVGPSLMSNFDVRGLFRKSSHDMADAQTPAGLVPNTAPEFVQFPKDFRDSPEWGSACVLIPWQRYVWYGDASALRDNYDTMKRYVDYLSTRATNHILSHGLGDWYDLGPRKELGEAQLTPKALTATAFYFRDAQVLSAAAKMLGRQDEAATYAHLADAIRAAFNREFYHADAHTYATASQTALAIPLAMNLAPPEDRPAILDVLVRGIRANADRLTAGDIGYRFLLRALADGGRSDVIFDMNRRSDRPGYAYILNTGATSLTEGWDGSASQNHFMLGHIMEWFYCDLAGIAPDEAAPGFARVRIHPTPVGDITWEHAKYDSVRGPVESAWKIEGEKITLDVTIPPNASAVVDVPTTNVQSVHQDGAPVAGARCEIGSGRYRFTAEWKGR